MPVSAFCVRWQAGRQAGFTREHILRTLAGWEAGRWAGRQAGSSTCDTLEPPWNSPGLETHSSPRNSPSSHELLLALYWRWVPFCSLFPQPIPAAFPSPKPKSLSPAVPDEFPLPISLSPTAVPHGCSPEFPAPGMRATCDFFKEGNLSTWQDFKQPKKI